MSLCIDGNTVSPKTMARHLIYTTVKNMVLDLPRATDRQRQEVQRFVDAELARWAAKGWEVSAS